MPGVPAPFCMAQEMEVELERGTVLQRTMQKKQKMKTVNLLFPHQLFQEHELYHNGFPVYLIEEQLFFKQFNFHKTKLAYHRASMKSHEALLKKKGLTVKYIESPEPASDVRVLLRHLAQENIGAIHFIHPTDHWLEKRIQKEAKQHNIKWTAYENPLFINTREELSHFFKPGKQSFFQTTFYKQQRTQRGILLDKDHQPLGGQWSYDNDNRKRYPKGKVPPAVLFPKPDDHWTDAIQYVEKHFSDNIGQLHSEVCYPHNRHETDRWLQQFFRLRFKEFGAYEDAIVQNESVLHHSVLTPMMNAGIIKPQEVLESAIAYARTHDIPLNSLEGFVRQILGWREFIRGYYECKGVEARTRNYWNFHRKIPPSFYSGTTGIEPIDHLIKKVLRDGYCHHIERLMVLGNFMLLCEFDPNEVYRWFMELFIDSYDWVMVPNVYGMSQFADGGAMATKPYISGSNYLMKMSDYPKGDWQQVWDGLFWHFMNKQRDFFLKNPRLSMLIKTYDKMEVAKQKQHLHQAAQFLHRLDEENKSL